MSMSGTVRALIALLTAIVMLYIIEITFGAAMDSLYVQFYALSGTLPMTAGWSTVSISVLGGWVWFYRSFVIAIIAVGVWVAESIIIEIDYGRTSGGLR